MSLPKCGIKNPDYPEIQCTFMHKHHQVHDSQGRLWDHSNSEKGAYWNMPNSAAQCGSRMPEDNIGCTLPKGHGLPLKTSSGTTFDHANLFYGKFWDEPKEPCGAYTKDGPCKLPSGHNVGKVDIPENHEPVRTDMDMKTPLEILEDLESRLNRADRALRDMAEVEVPEEANRLYAKASGVMLALSYVQEELRSL